MVDVVPPQTMCLPSLEKNSDIMRSLSSRLDGGPKSRFMGTRFRIRTTQAVVSSPGLCVVQPVALVHQNGGKGLGRVTGGSLRLHIGDNILPLPAEVVGGADARVWASVAHER